MLKSKFLFVGFLILSLTGLGAAELQIEVSNLQKSKKGSNFYIAVYDNEKDQKAQTPQIGKFYKLGKKPSKKFEASVSGLEVGKKYVLQFYQDLDLNGKLDTNALGMPTEPTGFSNNVRPKMGPPAYKELEFKFSKDKQKIEIKLLY